LSHLQHEVEETEEVRADHQLGRMAMHGPVGYGLPGMAQNLGLLKILLKMYWDVDSPLIFWC
jgi:hypothetical protein